MLAILHAGGHSATFKQAKRQGMGMRPAQALAILVALASLAFAAWGSAFLWRGTDPIWIETWGIGFSRACGEAYGGCVRVAALSDLALPLFLALGGTLALASAAVKSPRAGLTAALMLGTAWMLPGIGMTLRLGIASSAVFIAIHAALGLAGAYALHQGLVRPDRAAAR